MKKYYFLIPDLSAGGAERVSITIARILKKNGFDVEFLNMGSPDGEMKSWIEPEFQMTSFGCNRVLAALPKLKAFMKNHPDGNYFSSREHTNLIGLLAAKQEHRDIVVRIPNMPNNKLEKGLSGFKMRIIKSLNKRMLPYAKNIIAQNSEMRKQLLSFYSLTGDKVVAINNPIDKDFVIKSAEGFDNPFPKEATVFLAACTIDYRKGIDVLMKAWHKVKSSIPNAKAYVIGRDTSDYAAQLKNEAQNLNDFVFLGFKSNPYPYLKYCDVFVLPSRMEGFPNVVLEAMCFDRPVASTTCVNVIKDIIQPGKNGCYCDIEDADALASAMLNAAKLKGIENSYNLFQLDKLLEVFK